MPGTGDGDTSVQAFNEKTSKPKKTLRSKNEAICIVPKEHPVAKPVLQKVLAEVGIKDRPGIVPEENLMRMVTHFQDAFGGPDPAHKPLEEEFSILRVKTQKRYGADATGIDCSKNQKRVYRLFTGRLNAWERVFFTVDVGETSSAFSRILSIFLMITIVLSILNWMLGTMPENQRTQSKEECPSIDKGDCEPELLEGFQIIEKSCIYIFTVEYLLKVLCAHSVRFEIADAAFLENFLTSACRTGKMPQLQNRLITEAKFIIRGTSLIDLVSIAPYWFEFFVGEGSGGSFFVILRILRLTRIFRVFKLGKYNEVFSLFGRVMQQSQPALYLMLFFITLGMCLFGTLMWFTEQGEWYPQGHQELLDLGILDRGAFLRDESVTSATIVLAESPFASILHSFWFVIVTITTAGYGDMYPTTGGGKFFGTITILCGIIVLAMPVGVIGANFSQEYDRILLERIKLKKTQRIEQLEKAVRQSMKGGEDDRDFDEVDHDGEDSDEDDEEDDVIMSQDLQLMFGLLDKATVIENEIAELLPEASLKCITQDLRSFTSELLMSRDNASQNDLRVGLDKLLFGAFAHLRSVLNFEPGSDPSAADILTCRRHFMELATGCWAYWQEHPPRVEHIQEVYDMKAMMTSALKAKPMSLPMSAEVPPSKGGFIAESGTAICLPGVPEAIG